MATRSSVLLGVFILSLPITMRMGSDSLPSDTASRVLAGTMQARETRFTGGAGLSSFGIVDRGCDNEILRSKKFRNRDVGGDLEQHVAGPLSIGLRAGAIHQEVEEAALGSLATPPGPVPTVTNSTRENSYFNPYVRLQSRSSEISAGGIVFHEPFRSGDEPPGKPTLSLGLRIGRLDRVAFRASWMEGVPLLSQNDPFSVGAEAWPTTKVGLFIGGAFGPSRSAFLLRGQWWVVPAAALNFSGRIGPTSGDIPASGASIGLTLRTPPQVEAAHAAGERDASEALAAPPATPRDSSRRSP